MTPRNEVSLILAVIAQSQWVNMVDGRISWRSDGLKLRVRAAGAVLIVKEPGFCADIVYLLIPRATTRPLQMVQVYRIGRVHSRKMDISYEAWGQISLGSS